jgi:transketolase
MKALYGLNARRSNKPLVVIADTIKGKGIDHISCQPLWHGGAPINIEDIVACRKDLGKNNG